MIRVDPKPEPAGGMASTDVATSRAPGRSQSVDWGAALFLTVALWFFSFRSENYRCIEYSCSYSLYGLQPIQQALDRGLMAALLIPAAAAIVRPVPRPIRRVIGGFLALLGVALAVEALVSPYPVVLASSPWLSSVPIGAALAGAGALIIWDTRLARTAYSWRAAVVVAVIALILWATCVWVLVNGSLGY